MLVELIGYVAVSLAVFLALSYIFPFNLPGIITITVSALSPLAVVPFLGFVLSWFFHRKENGYS